jgi:hypothetical protein
MNITKLAQDDNVYFWVAVDEKGNRVVYLEDGQNLGKKCDKLIDMVAPSQGVIGHNHADYNKGEGQRKAPAKTVVTNI